MVAQTFNPIAYSKELKEVGFSEKQADAIAELVNEQLATKHDLRKLELATKQDLQNLEQAMSRDMQALEKNVKQDMQTLEKNVKQDMQTLEKNVKQDMQTLEERLTYKLTIRLGTMMVAGITVLATLMKLL